MPLSSGEIVCSVYLLQRKLERLLQAFPQEPVEAKRWSKIANALGNRTPKQVHINHVKIMFHCF